jgi:3-oxoacyl-[acyl-carrier protein] reductase
MKLFRGRKAMVTGAASGIGRCIALALADEGVSLCLTDIDENNLRASAEAAQSRGVQVLTKVCDLSQPSEITGLVNFVLSAWGQLNILVNCAGICHYGPTDAMDDAKWRRTLSVNLLAPIQLVRELLPTLMAQDEANIVNVCSIYGLVASNRIAAYQASKFGLVGFSKALQVEYASPEFGITALCPGYVRTALIEKLAGDWAKDGIAMPSWLAISPETVADKALSAMRNNQRLIVFPASARIVWWLSRLSPGLVQWFTRKGIL